MKFELPLVHTLDTCYIIWFWFLSRPSSSLLMCFIWSTKSDSPTWWNLIVMFPCTESKVGSHESHRALWQWPMCFDYCSFLAHRAALCSFHWAALATGCRLHDKNNFIVSDFLRAVARFCFLGAGWGLGFILAACCVFLLCSFLCFQLHSPLLSYFLSQQTIWCRHKQLLCFIGVCVVHFAMRQKYTILVCCFHTPLLYLTPVLIQCPQTW